jgi:hypothetical protein
MEPALHNILKLAEVLGVDPGELMHGLRAPAEGDAVGIGISPSIGFRRHGPRDG